MLPTVSAILEILKYISFPFWRCHKQYIILNSQNRYSLLELPGGLSTHKVLCSTLRLQFILFAIPCHWMVCFCVYVKSIHFLIWRILKKNPTNSTYSIVFQVECPYQNVYSEYLQNSLVIHKYFSKYKVSFLSTTISFLVFNPDVNWNGYLYIQYHPDSDDIFI